MHNLIIILVFSMVGIIKAVLLTLNFLLAILSKLQVEKPSVLKGPR